MSSLQDVEDSVKVATYSFAWGMTNFALSTIFNPLSFIAVLVQGLAKQSTGIYLLFLATADFFLLSSWVFTNEFYHWLIGVDIFEKSGEPLILCQVIIFFQEWTYIFRWAIVAILVVDRCLVVAGVDKCRLWTASLIISIFMFVVCCGLAGYWIFWVKDDLITDAESYQYGQCVKKSNAADDQESAVFYMHTIMHIIMPDVLSFVPLVVGTIVLYIRLQTKSVKVNLDDDDLDLSRATAGVGLANIIFITPYLIVACVILWLEKNWDVFDYSETVGQNLKHAKVICRQFKHLSYCLLFFFLLFGRQFRHFCCKN